MISKKTVDELLQTYLNDKGIEEDKIDKIMWGLHKGVKKEEDRKEKQEKKEKEKERKKSKTKISHGTSCPRIMTNSGDLVDEF